MNQSTTHSMFFIAILCPPELDKKVLQFKYWMREHFGSVVALRSPAHITLVQPFWLEMVMEEKLLQILRDFRSDMDALEMELDGFSHFGNRVLFVRVKENPSLEEIKNQAENHFSGSFENVITKDDQPFHPHITVANRDLKPADFEKAWLHFGNQTFREKFSTRTISLLKLTEGKWKVIGEKIW